MVMNLGRTNITAGVLSIKKNQWKITETLNRESLIGTPSLITSLYSMRRRHPALAIPESQADRLQTGSIVEKNLTGHTVIADGLKS